MKLTFAGHLTILLIYQEADAAINSVKQVLALTLMKKKVQEMSYPHNSKKIWR